ncbi:MAG: hypothetical protein ACJA0Q_001615 [Saprospiraceae bacterium]|jgi:hypothetical protein
MKFTGEIKISSSESLEEVAVIIGNIFGVNFTLDEELLSYPDTFSYYTYNLGFHIEIIGIKNTDYWNKIKHGTYTINITEILNHDSNEAPINLSERMVQVINSFENHQLKAYILN